MPGEKEIRDVTEHLKEYLKEVTNRALDLYFAGEGDILIEMRNPEGVRIAKIKGGPTKRIGGKKNEGHKED